MAAYTQCLRCAGAPRRPAGGSGLSLPFLLGMPLSMTPGSSIIASPELRCRHRLRRDLSGSALPILPQSVSRGPRISGLPDSRICYGLPSGSPPLYGSDRYTRPTRAFTSRLPAGRSPSPLLDMTTTATGLLCWRDSHPLEWQLASLHQIVPWSTLCRADWVRDVQSLPRAAGYYATTTQFLRELREAMRQRANIQGVSLMGLGKRGRLRVDQSTITG